MPQKAKTMTVGPTIGASAARALLDFAVSRGAQRSQLLREAALTADDLADPDGRVAWRKYVALMRAAQKLCCDPALALHFGEAVDPRDLSITGNIAQAGDKVADGLNHFNRYTRLYADLDVGGAGERFQLVREAGATWLVDNRANPNALPEFTESTFARLACWTRKFAAPGDAFVKAVEVTHARPDYAAEYERVLQAPVRFEAKRNALLIDETWRPRDAPWPSQYVSKVLAERADKLLEALDDDRSMCKRVENAILPMLHTSGLSVSAVAQRLGLSRKTLHRRLKQEGVTYSGVLDRLRHRLALDYLNDRKLSVNETAYLLGFSAPSAFSRAFTRWTGASPRSHRED
jgi:AraC-like DNA-binding protein